MFDLRKFWLRTAMFVSIMGAVIVAVGAAFHAFIGITTQGHPQVVPQTARIAGSGRHGGSRCDQSRCCCSKASSSALTGPAYASNSSDDAGASNDNAARAANYCPGAQGIQTASLDGEAAFIPYENPQLRR